MDVEFHQLDLRYESLRARHLDRYRRLVGSLAAHGQKTPIVVVAQAEAQDRLPRYVVIEGHETVRALKRLHQDTVRATVWNLDEAEALLLARALRIADSETALEQGWLLSELRTTFSLQELAQQFDRSLSWVSRRLALVQDLPEAVQRLVRQGKIGAHAAMRYLVPMARQSAPDCERLALAMAQEKFTSSEVKRLYKAWRKGPKDLRQRLLEDPSLFLRARSESDSPPPVLPASVQKLLADLDLIATLARRCEREWKAESLSPLDTPQCEEIFRCLEQTRRNLNRLAGRFGRQAGPKETPEKPASPPTPNPRAATCAPGERKEVQSAESIPAHDNSRTAPAGDQCTPDRQDAGDRPRHGQVV